MMRLLVVICGFAIACSPEREPAPMSHADTLAFMEESGRAERELEAYQRSIGAAADSTSLMSADDSMLQDYQRLQEDRMDMLVDSVAERMVVSPDNIDLQRLVTERQRLGVERQRLATERERLAVEQINQENLRLLCRQNIDVRYCQ